MTHPQPCEIRQKFLVLLTVLCLSFLFSANGSENSVNYATTNSAEKIFWPKLLNRASLSPSNLLYSEGIDPEWKGQTLVSFAKLNWVMLPLELECASNFDLTISGVTGGSFCGFEVFINEQKIGTFPYIGTEPKRQTLTFKTGNIPHNDNLLVLRPLSRGPITLHYISLKPTNWLQAKPTDWQITTNKAKQTNNINQTLLPAGATAQTFFYNSCPGRPAKLRCSLSAPAKIILNGEVISELKTKGEYFINIPPLPEYPLNNLSLSSSSNLEFSLAITSPGDVRFMKQIPQYFRFTQDELSPQHKFPTATIKGGDLQVILTIPDMNTGYYRSGRFESGGMVISANYNGTEFFVQPNPVHNPIKMEDGAGTAEEFSEPLEYYNIDTGNKEYIKAGVGVFLRSNWSNFNINAPAFPVKIFPWKYYKQNKAYVFEQNAQHDQWSYTYRKTIHIDESNHSLIVDYELTNTGSRYIETCQYSHNFISIGGIKPGSDYDITYNVPVTFQFDKYQDNQIEFAGKKFIVNKIPRVFFARLTSDGGLNSVNLFCKKNNRGVELFTSSQILRSHLYISPKLISPEFFVSINLKPGESKKWSRRWRFY